MLSDSYQPKYQSSCPSILYLLRLAIMSVYYLLTANPNADIKLSCGCKIPFWKVLIVTASQIQAGKPTICPEHNVPHEFSNCDIFKDLANKFYDKFMSDDDADPIIFLG